MWGVYSTGELRARGLSPNRIAILARQARLRRLRRGWYADETADPTVSSAVAAGGALTCVSALARWGVWTMPHPEIHIRMAAGTRAAPGGGRRLHWTRHPIEHPLDDLATALTVAVSCVDLRAAVVLVDSIRNRRLLDERILGHILDTTPRGRRVLALSDRRAESGIETLPRLALRSRNLRVRPQAVIDGVGRVDLLIGDRLVLELDGREWHGDFEKDRARDRALVALGYLVIRASYRQVLDGWALIERQILEIVRRRDHLWRRSLPQGRRRP